jgi:hypothetical protein
MQAVDLDGLEMYAGYDIVPELIAHNQQLYGCRRGHFFAAADIARAQFPAWDAILCRRVLCEMPEAEALRALAAFRASGARYLLATPVCTRAQTRAASSTFSPRRSACRIRLPCFPTSAAPRWACGCLPRQIDRGRRYYLDTVLRTTSAPMAT